MADKVDLTTIAQEICTLKGLTFHGSVGNGEFKQTFHVKDLNLASLALKVFFQGASSARQEREISAMQKCTHPSIAKLIEVSTHIYGGLEYWWMIEEFLDGGTFTSKLNAGTLGKEITISYGAHLIDAISHLADLKLVHRDLKPDNIMFRKSAEIPVIVDFGLVRDLSQTSLTQTWATRGPGTALFSSPEQLINEKELIDWRSDQFALGTIFAIAMFKIHPYQHSSDTLSIAVERTAKRMSQSPAFIQAANGCGMEILIRMTAPWPVQRFRAPNDLASGWKK